MKKILTLVVTLLFIGGAIAQDFPADRYKSESVTWLGLDFTKAKLVNHDAFTNPYAIVNSMMRSWNNIVLAEPDKYNLPRYLHNSKLKIDLKYTDKINMEIDPDALVQNEPYHVSIEDIIADAKKYKGQGEGLGVVMYVESFDKPALNGFFWFTIVDLKSGEVIYYKKVSGKPGGFGVRNYWLGSFYKALRQLDKDLGGML